MQRERKKFKNINLNDPLFDSLGEFPLWFAKLQTREG